MQSRVPKNRASTDGTIQYSKVAGRYCSILGSTPVNRSDGMTFHLVPSGQSLRAPSSRAFWKLSCLKYFSLILPRVPSLIKASICSSMAF